MGARDRLLQANANNKKIDSIPSENLIDDIVKETPTQEIEPETEPIIEHIDEPISAHIPLKPRKKVTKNRVFSIRLYPDIYSIIEKMARDNKMSLNEVINQLLAHALDVDLPS